MRLGASSFPLEMYGVNAIDDLLGYVLSYYLFVRLFVCLSSLLS